MNDNKNRKVEDETGWSETNSESGIPNSEFRIPKSSRLGRILRALLPAVVIVASTALIIYALVFTWEFDPGTQGGYTVEPGKESYIEVVTPTGIAHLIQQPANTFIHDDNSAAAPRGYEQAGYSSANLDAFDSDGAYVRLARQPNGGYYPTGDFTSRVIDNGSSQTWTGLQWTDSRLEVPNNDTSLVTIWHMNNNWNDSATAGTANNGTGNGGIGFSSTNAVFNQSGNFVSASSQYVSVADQADLQFGIGNFTISAWINLSTVGVNQTIIQKRNDDGAVFANNRGWELWVDSTNMLTFSLLWVDDPGAPTEVANTDITTSKALTSGKWYHVTVTRNVDVISIYVDSELVGTGTIDPIIDITAATFALEIGRLRTPASQYFNGFIDEVALYKARVLTESEIRKYYTDGYGIKFQVRASDDPDFVGINFTGPTGVGDYYTDPILPTASVSFNRTGRYFQYKAYLEKPSNADATPALKTVTVNPGAYSDNTQVNFDAGTYSQTVWNTDYIRLLSTYNGSAPRTGNEDNIVALWKMDDAIGDDKIDDSAMQGANSDTAWLGKGVAAAKPTQEASKAGFSNCLRFDGTDDYLYVTHTNDTLLKKELGLEAWVKFDNNFTAGAPVQMSIIRKKDSYELRFNKTTGKLDLVLYDNDPPPPTWTFMSGLDSLTDPNNLYWIVHQPMAVYKDRLYAGVSGDAANLPDPRLYYYDGTVWAEDAAFFTKSDSTYEGIYSTCVYDFNNDGTLDLLVGMGITADDADLFIQDGATGTWYKDNNADIALWGLGAGRGLEEKVTAAYGYTAITAMYDLNGELFLGFTSATAGQGDIWVYNPTAGWRKDDDALRGAGKGFDEKTDVTRHSNVEAFCLFGDKLYVGIGAIPALVDGFANVVAFDPATQSWANRVLVSGNVRTIHSLAVYAGKLYAGTGTSYPYTTGGAAGDGDIYASTDGATWAISYASPGYPYDIEGLGVFNGKLYAVGGRKRSFTTDYNYARVVEFDGSIWKPTYNTGTELGALGLTNGGQYGVASSLFVATGFDDALYLGCGMIIDDGDLFRYGSDPYSFSSSKNSWTNGVWYHISAGFDGTTIKLEIAQDGVGIIEETSYNQAFIVKPTNNPVLVGSKFDGVLDDVAIYKQNHVGYRTSGIYTSPVINPTLEGAIVQWNQIKWAEDEYFGDELTSASGLVGLYHMNESLWNGTANEVVDASGGNNHGTAKNGATTNSAFYRFGGYSGGLDGVDNYIEVLDTGSFNWTDKITLDAWIKTGDVLQQSVIAKGDGIDQNEFYLGLGADGIPFGWVSFNGIDKSTFAYGPLALNNNKWNHVALVYDGMRIIVYSNGEAGSAVSFSGSVANRANPIWIGSDAETLWAFNGYIDEVAVHNRALSAAEVLAHYKHGALSLKFQVRSGDTNPPPGSFVGPDGTVNTYYTVGTGQSITKSNGSSNLGKYFQYKAFLNLETMKYTPRLEGIRVSHTPYYAANTPWVTPISGQMYANAMVTVSEVLGAGNQGVVKYQFSPDNGTNWWYYNGGWQNLGGAPTYASGTNLLSDLDRTKWGSFTNPGTFKFRAYLVSNGLQPVVLDSVYCSDIYFEVKTPNGSESFTAGNSYPGGVTWDYSGSAGTTVDIGYYTEYGEAGQTWHPLVTGINIASKSWDWNSVSDTVSTKCRMNISTNNGLVDLSDADFTISNELVKSITVLTPTITDKWYVGTPYNIEWTSEGGVGPVTIEYAKDGTFDGDEITVVAGTANDGIHPWTPQVADIADATGKIRIYETGNPLIINNSPLFTVRCKLTIDTSTGVWSDLKWVVGTQKLLEWTNTGMTDGTNPLVLEWDRDTFDGGSEPTILIATGLTGTSLAWNIPLTSTLGANYDVRMRIRTLRALEGGTQPYSEYIIDPSKYFKICGKVQVDNPLINDINYVNVSLPISWTRTGNITNVRIECSVDDGLTYPFVVVPSQATPPDTIPWVIPRTVTPTLTARIRVRDATFIAGGDPDVEAISPKFIIRGKLQLTNDHPGQYVGQEFLIGNTTPITWTTTGVITAVNLYYLKDADKNPGTGPFGGYETTVAIIGPIVNSYNTTVDIDTGYSWPIPADLTPDPNDRIKIRVEDASTDFKNDVYSVSANPFKIKGSITVIYPNDGTEVFTAYDVTYQTQKFPITWTVNGPINQVSLYYSVNGLAGPWNLIDNVVCGSSGTYGYSWSVPNNALSTGVRISATNIADININDYSNNNFKVRGKVIVDSPNLGTEVWKVGSNQTIQWTQVGDYNVTIQYSTDNFASDVNDILVNDVRGDGPQSYIWPIPLDAKLSPVTPTITVRIMNAADSVPLDPAEDTYDLSNNPFKLRGDLTLTFPVGGTFGVDQPINVTWLVTGTNLTAAKLYYKVGAGGWQWIKDVLAWDKTTSWTIPDAISNNIVMKITNSVDEGTVYNEGSSFEIKGVLEVITPTLAQILQYGGNPITVTWKSTGGSSTFNQVALSFSTEGAGGPWYKMDDSGLGSTNVGNISGTNTYIWTVPDRVSSNCLIKAASTDWQNISDNSNAFIIKGILTLQYPVGGQVFTVNVNPVITWTKSTAVSNVKIEIDYGVGAGW
ncbi:MAG: hypothetical protein HY811_00005, partial [Planctomycetes bacterium]|nr:hypothetical protein [Planctomycetota bacterium]